MAHVFDTDIAGGFALPTRGPANAKSGSSASGAAFQLKLDGTSPSPGGDEAEGASDATAAQSWIVPASALLAQLEAAGESAGSHMAGNDGEAAEGETEIPDEEAALPGAGLLAAADLAAAGLLQEAGTVKPKAATPEAGSDAASSKDIPLEGKLATTDGDAVLAAAEVELSESAAGRQQGLPAAEADAEPQQPELPRTSARGTAAPAIMAADTALLATNGNPEATSTPAEAVKAPAASDVAGSKPAKGAELLQASAQLGAPALNAQAAPARTRRDDGPTTAVIATPEILRTGPEKLSLSIDASAAEAGQAADAPAGEADIAPETMRFAAEDVPAPDAKDRAAAQPAGPTAVAAPAPVAGETADAAVTAKGPTDPVTGLERAATAAPVAAPAPAPAAAPAQPAPVMTSAPPPGTVTAAPDQVADVISRSLAGDDRPDRITVQLDPPELGRVSIDFKFDGQALQHVTITGQTPEAVRQLRLLHFDLVQSLEQQGLTGQDMTFQDQSSQQNRFMAAEPQTGAESEGSDYSVSVRSAPAPVKRPLTQITTAGLDVRF